MHARTLLTRDAIVEGARYASIALIIAVALHIFSATLAAPWWGVACGILAIRIVVKLAGPELYNPEIQGVKLFQQIRDPLTASALWMVCAAILSYPKPWVGRTMGFAIGAMQGLTIS